jgi:hypothetical protein
MPYKVGQSVCLWQEMTNHKTGIITIVKEVIVKITETKTGVRGEFSRSPTDMTSLRGKGNDGKIYFKHWDYWPESQTSNFIEQWTLRNDGEGEKKFWIPKEAVFLYNEVVRYNERFKKNITCVDTAGQPIVPKGDVEYCKKHGEYHYKGVICFGCMVEHLETEKK